MSFLCCCCCARRKPADEAGSAPPAGADEDVEIARGTDENSLCDFDGPMSPSNSNACRRRKPRNACVLASGRIRWDDRSTSRAGSEVSHDGESSEDSYDAEFTQNARGAPSRKQTLYAPYQENNAGKPPPNANKAEKGIYLRSLALRQERTIFLEGRESFFVSVLSRMNEERVKHGSKPLKTRPEFDQLAEQLWKDRVQVHDGFVLVPRCVYFPREFKRGQRFGCLTFYTPRSGRIAGIPEAMVHFWRHAGVPRKPAQSNSAMNFRTNSQSDFPSAAAGESYVPDKTSAMHQAFERYRKKFPEQLLASACRFAGLHADMVQLAGDNSYNLVCVVVVFDFVASAKGRKMTAPFE